MNVPPGTSIILNFTPFTVYVLPETLLDVAAAWETEIETDADDFPNEIVPEREVVLVDFDAVTVKLVVPFEPVEGDRVIHNGLLIVCHEKLEVIEIVFEPPSAVKSNEVTLADISSLITAAL